MKNKQSISGETSYARADINRLRASLKHGLPQPVYVGINTHTVSRQTTGSLVTKSIDLIHDNFIIACAIMVLLIGSASIKVIGQIMEPSISLAKTASTYKVSAIVLNESVPAADLNQTLNKITGQTATLNLGTATVSIPSSTIASWISVTPSSSKTTDNIHLNTGLIGPSLESLAKSYEVSPIDQITATRSDGTSEVAIAGRNGLSLSNPSVLNGQSGQIAKNLFSGNGINASAALVSVPYQNQTPANFSKFILVDVNSKKMYIYQNGQIINTFLVSAGAPDTPTPIGEFHIWEKLPVQNMSGYGPGGKYYFQPNVEWVNYFTHTGDAIHGVYWHPLSWFGVHNSSHGCVGVPDNTAQWIYNWAPIGTPVVTTSN